MPFFCNTVIDFSTATFQAISTSAKKTVLQK